MKYLFITAIFFSFQFSYPQQKTFPLAAVDEAPFIKECYDPNKDTKECFNQNLHDHLQSNLVTPKTVKGEGRAYASFLITSSGEIEDIQVRATDEDQKAEVIRVLKTLKIEKPAELKGKAVAVTHATPVIFKQTMYDSYSAFFETRAKNLPHATETAFPPLFKNCVAEKDKGSCLSKTIEGMITENVNAKPGTVLNYYFEIDANANTENVIVLSHNDNNVSKQAKEFLEELRLEAPARNELKQAVKSYFYGKLIL